MPIKTSKIERQRRKRWNRMSTNYGITKKRYNIQAMGTSGEERKKWKKYLK